jgi:hypothetical protein
MSEQQQSGRQFLWWMFSRGFGLLVLVSIFDFALTWAGAQGLINELDGREQILLDSAFVSGLLTLVLVYVYRNLGKIQSNQSMILEKQSDLMRLQHKPRVYVRDFDPDMVGANVGVELENMGNGPAEKLWLRADLLAAKIPRSQDPFTHLNDIELAPGPYEFSSKVRPLQRFEPRENERLTESPDLNSPSMNSSARRTGGSLASTDGRVWFKAPIAFFDSPSLDPLSLLARHLDENGYERAALYLTVIYSDIEENLQGTLITHIEFPIREDLAGQRVLEDQPIWSHNLDAEVCKQIQTDLGEISLSGFNPQDEQTEIDADPPDFKYFVNYSAQWQGDREDVDDTLSRIQRLVPDESDSRLAGVDAQSTAKEVSPVDEFRVENDVSDSPPVKVSGVIPFDQEDDGISLFEGLKPHIQSASEYEMKVYPSPVGGVSTEAVQAYFEENPSKRPKDSDGDPYIPTTWKPDDHLIDEVEG